MPTCQSVAKIARHVILVGMLISLSVGGATAVAQANLALGKTVIDGSGSWAGGTVGVGAAWNEGSFPAVHVIDGNTQEATNGTVSYWLSREQTPYEYFTLDLESNVAIERLHLFNTHNRQYNDRGTDEFFILAAADIDEQLQLVNPQLLIASNLSVVTSQADIVPDVFTASNGLIPQTARYLRFEALTSNYGRNNVGLNEIEIYDGLPLPGDFDQDEALTTADIDLLSQAVRRSIYDPRFDVNQDSALDLADHQSWVVDLKSTVAGDANLDGVFDTEDLVNVFVKGKYAIGDEPTGWAEGDWNGDWRFDSNDIVVAFVGGGFQPASRTTHVVPEPTGGGLSLLLGIYAVRTARRKTMPNA